MDYTGAERLKKALEKLEKCGISTAVANEFSEDKEYVKLLEEENKQLKCKQSEVLQQLDTVISEVESSLKENSKKENAA